MKIDDIVPIDWSAFWQTETVTEDFLLPPLVPAGRQVAVFGPPKAGKSLLVLDAVAATVTGRPVLGRQPVDPFAVLYLDMEMTEADLRERLNAMGHGPESDLSRLHYYQLQALPPLDTAEGGHALMALVERHGAKLVVLDTMARVVAGEENSADTYRSFYLHTGARLKAAGVALLRLDHQGHDATHQRGSSAKADDVDVVFKLTTNGSRTTLTRTHTRIPWVPPAIVTKVGSAPHLHHVLVDAASDTTTQPAGTHDLAMLLDDLGVPIDASATAATAALRLAGHGRRKELVLAALKHRRERP